MLHYSATAKAAANGCRSVMDQSHFLPRPESWSIDTLYPNTLFHGPTLQVVQQLLQFSDSFATALLCQAEPLGGLEQQWHTPLPLLDGALQLALLWMVQRYDRDTLPIRLQRCWVKPDSDSLWLQPQSLLQFTLQRHDPQRCCGDLALYSASGELIALIEALEVSGASSRLIFRQPSPLAASGVAQ
ncbi:hypothetical protein D5085_00075 [Ectothiorhodospiraceae bacterium BW-2]|nr:hypothetical protein D5085_00075 [Ectothiorhodospiraceae bacterium BW-2]